MKKLKTNPAADSTQSYDNKSFLTHIGTRKTIEENPKKIENGYRLLFDCLSEAVVIMDPPAWTLLSGNAAFLKMFYIQNMGELSPFGLWDVSPEKQPDGAPSRNKIMEMIQAAVERGSISFEWMFRRGHGEMFPASVVLTSVKLPTATFLQAEIKDISEQKKTMEALHKTQDRYKALFETTGTAMIVYDEEKTIIMCNKKFEALYGRNRSEILGKIKWTDFVEKDDLERMSGYHNLRHTTKPPAEYEFKFINADGQVRTVYHMVKYLEDSKERIASLIDITELKQIERQLSESEEKYRTLVDRSPDGIFVLDFSGNFLSVSRAMCERLGYAECELLSTPIWKIIPEKSRELFHRRLTGITAGESIHETVEYEIIGKDGKSHYAEVHSTPYIKGGKAIGFEGIAREITERKTAEMELRQYRENLEVLVKERTRELELANERLLEANEKLKELDQLKSMFMASMSHELRTPLNSIIGFTGVLLQEIPGKLNKEQQKQLNMVRKSSQYLLSLINDIIDINKIEGGKALPKISRFDLTETIHEVARSFKAVINDKGLKLSIETPDMLPMLNDERRIRQIIINYLSNALKFTEQGGIGLSVETLDGMAVIKVIDTGIGIQDHETSKLFKSFSQIVHSGKLYEGAGLGLHLSKKIADMLGGSVIVESVYGKGSTFILKIPISYGKIDT